MIRCLSVSFFLLFVSAMAQAACPDLVVGSATIKVAMDEISIQQKEDQKLVPLKEESIGECLSLSLAGESKKIIAVEFWGPEKGTKVLVSNHMYGLIDLEKGDWAVEPFRLESKVDAKGVPEKRVVSAIEWRKSPEGMTLWRKLPSSEALQIFPEIKKAATEPSLPKSSR